MKKLLLILLCLPLLFSSCKKCQDCTCTPEGLGTTTQEVCKGDLSTVEYNAAITVLENEGCDCN